MGREQLPEFSIEHIVRAKQEAIRRSGRSPSCVIMTRASYDRFVDQCMNDGLIPRGPCPEPSPSMLVSGIPLRVEGA